MNMQHLRNIREYELNKVMSFIPAGSSVLELGAGAGWQSKVLADHGFAVKAIDVKESIYAEHRVWPVQLYDGVSIPFPNDSFGVVFSSNVLEHIANIEQFQSEIKRVLKPEGIAIHVLPTGSWRFWTNLSYYLTRPREILCILRHILEKKQRHGDKKIAQAVGAEPIHCRDGICKKIFKSLLFPSGHGAMGNCLSQIYLFSRFRWKSLFRKTGWSLQGYYPNRLFYTGYAFFGSLFSIDMRRMISYVLGSSCLIYVLTKKEQRTNKIPNILCLVRRACKRE